MSLQRKSDEIALIAGLTTAGALELAGCPPAEAVVAGLAIAVMIDLPFGSITDLEHQGRIHPIRTRRIKIAPLPQPMLARFNR